MGTKVLLVISVYLEGKQVKIRNIAMLLGILAVLYSSCSVAAAEGVQCDNGANVAVLKYCKNILYYHPLGPTREPRIASVLATDPTRVRSIALIVAIDTYPIAAWNLPPAARDLVLLKALAIDQQRFDEVIVLHNSDATREAIEYFLTRYIPKQLDYYAGGKTRVMFAYTGHGVRKNNKSSARLVLGDARSDSDPEGTLEVTSLHQQLSSISLKSFHLLALINACYGGDFLSIAEAGGSTYIIDDQGAYGLTAGRDDALAWSIDKDHGSIFFEALYEGITTGAADPRNLTTVTDGKGRSRRIANDAIRLGMLVGYLNNSVQELGKNPRTGKRYGEPWSGPISPIGSKSYGAFFFMPPRKIPSALPTGQAKILVPVVYPASPVAPRGGTYVAQSAIAQNPSAEPLGLNFSKGAVSAIPYHPEIKIFNPPESYPIHGIDVSKWSVVNWNLVAASKTVDFAYVRASGIRGVDPAFFRHRSSAERVGIIVGAYHFVSFCQTAAEQLTRIKGVVPTTKNMLPFAVDIEWPVNPRLTEEVKCAADRGIKGAREHVRSIVAGVGALYNRMPVVYSNAYGFNNLISDIDVDFHIWLGDNSSISEPRSVQVNLAGGRSWMFWQYDIEGQVGGVTGPSDRNTFYGSRGQFKELLSH